MMKSKYVHQTNSFLPCAMYFCGVIFFSKKGFLILMLLIISTIFYAMNETHRYSTVNFLSFVLAWLLVVASHLVN